MSACRRRPGSHRLDRLREVDRIASTTVGPDGTRRGPSLTATIATTLSRRASGLSMRPRSPWVHAVEHLANEAMAADLLGPPLGLGAAAKGERLLASASSRPSRRRSEGLATRAGTSSGEDLRATVLSLSSRSVSQPRRFTSQRLTVAPAATALSETILNSWISPRPRHGCRRQLDRVLAPSSAHERTRTRRQISPNRARAPAATASSRSSAGTDRRILANVAVHFRPSASISSRASPWDGIIKPEIIRRDQAAF